MITIDNSITAVSNSCWNDDWNPPSDDDGRPPHSIRGYYRMNIQISLLSECVRVPRRPLSKSEVAIAVALQWFRKIQSGVVHPSSQNHHDVLNCQTQGLGERIWLYR